MCRLPSSADPAYLNRHQRYADAGVYRLTEELALVQTVDFFTPVVDDPYLFGQIAAANALSDVYAMGGKPLTALNLICFPAGEETLEMMAQILLGGYEKVREAGAALVGGHSVEDREPKYGLAVTGLVDPRRLMTGAGARPGDRLLLTKPLGTGIITTALKGNAISAAEADAAIKGMAALNDAAAAVMPEAGVSACTDITGFGLLGHLHELLAASGRAAEIDSGAVSFYPGAAALAAQGFIPGGAYRNLEYYREAVNWAGRPGDKEDRLIMLADPQTSGGLLLAVPPGRAAAALEMLASRNITGYLIGEIVEGPAGKITVI